jgi:2-oxoglutarate dehydrogenase E1 component
VEDLTQGQFQEIIPDAKKASGAKRLIFCQGKVFYDLDDHRNANNIGDTAIIRIEQMYPLHEAKLREIKAAHPEAKSLVWCQEESHNMGAWFFMEPRLRAIWGRDFGYAGRDASASPATGALAIHNLEQKDLVEQAFRI